MPYVQGPASTSAWSPTGLPEAKLLHVASGGGSIPWSAAHPVTKNNTWETSTSSFKYRARQAWMPWWPRLSPGCVPVIYHLLCETAINIEQYCSPVRPCIGVLLRMFRGCPGPGPGPGELSRFKGIVWIYRPRLRESFLYGEAVNTMAASPEILKHSSAHHGRNPTNTHPRKPQP